MIDLPPNFDVVQFAADIFQIVSPFVPIAAMFLAFALIKKLGNRL